MPRCPVCEDIVPSGCNCAIENGTAWEWSGDGSDGDAFVLDPILSADPDQLLQCIEDLGLLALVPDSLQYPPAVQAYNSANLSIANDTVTTVTCNTELYDTDTMHSQVSNTGRVTFTTAGLYAVTFVCAWKNKTGGDRVAQIRKNGSDATILSFDSVRAGGADLIVGHTVVAEDVFAATDYVEARVRQTSGAALLLLSESYSPFLSAARVA